MKDTSLTRLSKDTAAFENERKIWEQLGSEDPLWAVLSDDSKLGGKWDLDDFLATGEQDVGKYSSLLTKAGAPEQFSNVLDFGCGVGRLTLAWSRRAREVTGLDVSSAMVARAHVILQNTPTAKALLNPHPNLSLFPDDHFDLVASHICLQHIPPDVALCYISEFGRVCHPGGYVAFQLPARQLYPNRLTWIKRTIVDFLPFGLGPWYRKFKGSPGIRFHVYSHEPAIVIEAARRGGLALIHQEPDHSAGASLESFIYIFKKPVTPVI